MGNHQAFFRPGLSSNMSEYEAYQDKYQVKSAANSTVYRVQIVFADFLQNDLEFFIAQIENMYRKLLDSNL